MGIDVAKLVKMLRRPSLLLKPEGLCEAIPAFSFLAPFGQLLFGPLLLHLEYKRKGRPEQERKMLVGQEFIGQLVNVSVHVASFLLGGVLAGKLFPKINAKEFVKGSKALKDAQTLASMAGSFLGMTFLRPVVAAKVINGWAGKQPKSDSKTPVGTQPAPTLNVVSPSPPFYGAGIPPRSGSSLRNPGGLSQSPFASSSRYMPPCLAASAPANVTFGIRK
jgi:hypothetical protein